MDSIPPPQAPARTADTRGNAPARPAGYGGYSGHGPYAGYGASAGYGYGADYGNTVAQRNFEQYLLTLRERIWYIVATFLLVFSASLVFTLTRQKLYESSATVQIFRSGPVVMQVQKVVENEIRSSEDLNTQVKILESDAIIANAVSHLSGPDLENLVAPYRKADGLPPDANGIILNNRTIAPERLSLIVNVRFKHPNPVVAAQIANLLANEYIAYNEGVRVKESLQAVVDLRDRAEEQRKKVEQMAVDLQDYRQRNNLVSLDQRKDINTRLPNAGLMKKSACNRSRNADRNNRISPSCHSSPVNR